MIYLISRWEHAYTTESPRNACENFHFLSYDRLLEARELPRATYIFTDIDRLSVYELELASIVFRELAAGGARVMNDPAAVLTRYDLLRALHREGINDFNAYRPQSGEWPDRYPVFLRRNAFHQGVLSELLHSREALEMALKETLEQGIPHANTIAVEYAAEPAGGENVFRKFAAYRIGDRYFQDTTVNQKGWVVKGGEIGVAGEEFYQEECAGIDTVPDAATVVRVFEIAGIEYGRVDFGKFQGRPQFYEVNTNPTVRFLTEHPSPARSQSRRTFVNNYRQAIGEIGFAGARETIVIQSKVLAKLRRKFHPREHWFRPYRSRPSF